MNKDFWIIFVSVAIALTISVIFTKIYHYHYNDTGIIQIYDSFIYLVKSLEITRGNFLPTRNYFIGWPLLAAPFFYLIGDPSLFVNMAYAQFLNIIIYALSFVPIFYINKKLLTYKENIIALIITLTSFWYLYSAIGFFSEPLFTITILLTLIATIKSLENVNWILAASFFAGLSYWLRPNGIFIFLALILTVWLLRKSIPNFKWRYLFYATALFIAISAPHLFQRYQTFGSPFYYGENSKYFVDTYNQLWGAKDPNVSLLEYLKKSSFIEIFDRFIKFGLGGIIVTLLIITIPVSLFFWPLGIIAKIKEKRFVPLLVMIGIVVLSFSPLYKIYFTPRYFFPLIPLLSIFAAVGFNNFLKSINGNEKIKIGWLIIISSIFLFISFIFPQYYHILRVPHEVLDFGRWAGENLRGKIASVGDDQVIMGQFADLTVAKKGLLDIEAPLSKTSTIYPGYFENQDEMLKWLKNNNIDYLVLDRNYQLRISPPIQIYTGKIINSKIFQKIYEDFSAQSSWHLEVYKIQ